MYTRHNDALQRWVNSCTEIREVNDAIPLIFLTAKNLKDDVLKGYKIGADDYLTKPFDSRFY